MLCYNVSCSVLSEEENTENKVVNENNDSVDDGDAIDVIEVNNEESEQVLLLLNLLFFSTCKNDVRCDPHTFGIMRTSCAKYAAKSVAISWKSRKHAVKITQSVESEASHSIQLYFFRTKFVGKERR